MIDSTRSLVLQSVLILYFLSFLTFFDSKIRAADHVNLAAVTSLRPLTSEEWSQMLGVNNENGEKEQGYKLEEKSDKDSWLKNSKELKERNRGSQELWNDKTHDKIAEESKKKHKENWKSGKEGADWNNNALAEEYHRDRGHYYEKKYSWHRESHKKVSRGNSGSQWKEQEHGKKEKEFSKHKHRDVGHQIKGSEAKENGHEEKLSTKKDMKKRSKKFLEDKKGKDRHEGGWNNQFKWSKHNQ